MMNTKNLIGQYLLQSKAIKLDPANPFTWTSGWKAPIYCDNRITLSFPGIRHEIKNRFVQLIQKHFPEVELIAGVATGAIAQGALVAEALDLPFAYVRSKPKGHGLENLIEGKISAGQQTVVIEDLVSTGNSSLNAVEALKKAGCNVMGMCAIFTYNFDIAEARFRELNCPLFTLTDYNTLIELASQEGYVKHTDIQTLEKWRKDPGNWGQE